MSAQIKLRRDTSTNWSTANPILSNGEPGLETDTKRIKFGDGSTAWNALPYVKVNYSDILNAPAIPSLSGYATETYVNSAVNNVIGISPAQLNTLSELAAALGNDPAFAQNITTIVNGKANTADLADVATSGDYNDLSNKPTIPTVPTNVSEFTNDAGYLTSFSETDPVFSASPAASITNTQITNWNTSYGWGNHASAGYLTSYTENDPVFSASPAAGITALDIGKWNATHASFASTTYVNEQIALLVDSAPTTLNTLNELAAALGDDPNYATTLTTQLGLKANSADLAPVATSGDYADLTNKPTIPTDVSDLTDTTNLLNGVNTGDVTFSGVKVIGAGTASGDGNGYSTLELVPDNNLYGNHQYLVIDPTAPSHIHIRAGGTQDQSNAELYFGGERTNVRIADYSGVRLNRTNNNLLASYSYATPADYTLGRWFTEGGLNYIEYTTSNQVLANHVYELGNNPENYVTVYWNGGADAFTLRYGGSAQDMGGGVFRVQVDAAPQAEVSIENMYWEFYQEQTSYVEVTSDFTVNVTDDVRITSRDIFSLRNYSTSEPIEIRTDYDNADHNWSFNPDGNLQLPHGKRVNWGQNTDTLAAPVANGLTDRLTLWDFQGGGSGFNYAIGVEPNHVWFTMDVNNGTGGFKFYSRDSQIFKIRDDGALLFSDSSIQTTAFTGSIDWANVNNTPTNVSDFANDAGYLTSYTETDPVFSASTAAGITSTQVTNWNTAYGWGDHSTAGYLTSYTETDPVFTSSAASAITLAQITNWDTAYGWGNHAIAGYVSLSTLKTVVAASADFADFQTRIAAL